MSDEEQEAVQVSADEEEIVVVDELPAEKKEDEEPAPDPELVKLREENANESAVVSMCCGFHIRGVLMGGMPRSLSVEAIPFEELEAMRLATAEKLKVLEEAYWNKREAEGTWKRKKS